uniref:GTPase Der n=2 Tax=Ditylum brightwellii TaxID=49249 RepID=A0A7S4W2G9_9STRA
MENRCQLLSTTFERTIPFHTVQTRSFMQTGTLKSIHGNGAVQKFPSNSRCFFRTVASASAAIPTDFLGDGKSDLIVSILGPPNAGKSTLFNRLMCKEANKSYKLSSDNKSRKRNKHRRSGGFVGYKSPSPSKHGGAIVSSTPGTTRDRRECIGRIGGTMFQLVDTAGVDGERIGHLYGKLKNQMEREMIKQTLEAAKTSDLILLMFDAKVGVTADLSETARWLRKSSTNINSRVVILANKLEGDKWTHDDGTAATSVMEHLLEASRVGFGEPIPISAEHGEGLADIAIIVEEMIREKRERLGLVMTNDDYNVKKKKGDEAEKPLQLAILGRQNVGKSTLVNSLLKQDRVITGETPGLTRDSITVTWTWNNRPVRLCDTAGIRRATKRDRANDNIEDLAVADAMRSMKVADVAVMVLDARARMLQRQELAIADQVVKEGRALVVAANKMDLLGLDHTYSKEDYAQQVRQQLELRFPMLRKTPIVPMSGLTLEGVQDLMPVVFDARDRWSQKISTGLLNRWLEDVLDTKQPPLQSSGIPTKIKYIIQTKGRPPTFLLFCNTDELPLSYIRYLTRNFQETFKMYGMEVRLAVKKSTSENPFLTRNKPMAATGVGGWAGRQKRMIAALKKTGKPLEKGVRRRRQKYKKN